MVFIRLGLLRWSLWGPVEPLGVEPLWRVQSSVSACELVQWHRPVSKLQKSAGKRALSVRCGMLTCRHRQQACFFISKWCKYYLQNIFIFIETHSYERSLFTITISLFQILTKLTSSRWGSGCGRGSCDESGSGSGSGVVRGDTVIQKLNLCTKTVSET